MSVYLLVKPCG